MKIFIKVKTKAKEKKIEKIDENHFIVKVKELPEKGKANQEVIKIIAQYFKVSLSQVAIISGLKSKNKTIYVNF